MLNLVTIKTETFYVSTTEPSRNIFFDDKENGMVFIFHLHYVDDKKQRRMEIADTDDQHVDTHIYTVFYELMGIYPYLLGSYQETKKLYYSWELQPRSVDNRHKGTVTFYYKE